jgi:hypothetical protein
METRTPSARISVRTSAADQAVLLGDRDELIGEDQAADRMPPADQRLDAADGTIGDAHLGLVVQLQFAVVERAAQIAHDREPGCAWPTTAPGWPAGSASTTSRWTR